MSGFYRGCGTNLLRTTPSAVITFTSYEMINRFLQHLVPPHNTPSKPDGGQPRQVTSNDVNDLQTSKMRTNHSTRTLWDMVNVSSHVLMEWIFDGSNLMMMMNNCRWQPLTCHIFVSFFFFLNKEGIFIHFLFLGWFS